MIRLIGLGMATALTATAVTGIGALIMLDFPGVPKAFADGIKALFAPIEPPTDELLEGVDTITLFIRTPISGTSFDVSTGAAYDSPAAIAQRNPSNMWCYVQVGKGTVTTQVALGNKNNGREPVYLNLEGISEKTIKEIGVSKAALAKIAKTHCKFSDFDPTKAGT